MAPGPADFVPSGGSDGRGDQMDQLPEIGPALASSLHGRFFQRGCADAIVLHRGQSVVGRGASS